MSSVQEPVTEARLTHKLEVLEMKITIYMMGIALVQALYIIVMVTDILKR